MKNRETNWFAGSCRLHSSFFISVFPVPRGNTSPLTYVHFTEGLVSTTDQDKQDISRRDFSVRLGGAAAAALVLSRDVGAAPVANAAPLVSSRVRGAPDKVVLASIGVRGPGNALKRGFG